MLSSVPEFLQFCKWNYWGALIFFKLDAWPDGLYSHLERDIKAHSVLMELNCKLCCGLCFGNTVLKL